MRMQGYKKGNESPMPSPDYFRDNVSIDRIRGHILALEGPRHPVAAPEALERAADYIADCLRRLGYDMSEHHFDENGRTFRNVIATRPGLSHPEQRVVVLAHFDTVADTPGADDNASGVALLLELAEILQPFRFERTIHLIGVNLEENQKEGDSESGTRGSRALAGHVRKLGWEIEGVLVLESVAHSSDSVLQTFPAGISGPVPKMANFIAVVGNEKSLDLVQGFGRAVEKFRIDLPHFAMAVPGNGEALPDSRRSDHAPFWDQGYKAVMITDTTNFRSPHYHGPGDTLETLDLDFAVNVCRATGGLLVEMLRLAA
jgi:Zn-dependent M28 family amino/carboxypeptidase